MGEMSSVMKCVRGAMGLGVDNTAFDHELLLHINSAFADLNQNGIISEAVVTDESDLWEDFGKEGPELILMFEQIKLYVYLKTKILFDPPPPSTGEYMNERANELLWRLRESYDKGGDPLGSK